MPNPGSPRTLAAWLNPDVGGQLELIVAAPRQRAPDLQHPSRKLDILTSSEAQGANSTKPGISDWRSAVEKACQGALGFWWWIAALLTAFVVLQGFFFAATLMAASVPNSRVVGSLAVDASHRVWDAEDFPLDGVGHASDVIPFAGVSDSYTECVALTLGISADPQDDAGPLYRALASPHLGTCSTAFPSIAALAGGTTAGDGFTYSRYWNGSAVVSRPMLALGGVGAVRLTVAALLLAAIALAAIAFQRRSSAWLLVPLFAPLLLSTNLLTQTLDSYPHVLSFSVACFGVAAGAVLGRMPAPAIIIGGVVVGGVFNFVDFLLNPPMAWALFAFSVVASRAASSDRRASASLAALGASAAGWIMGYAGSWIARWVIAVAAFGDRALQEILSVVALRLQGDYADLVTPGLGQPTSKNLAFWWTTIPLTRVVVVASALAMIVALILLCARRDKRGLVLAAIAASPILLVFVWYELLSNHSQIHTWFTYRSLPAALGIATAAVWLPLLAKSRARRKPAANDVSDTAHLELADA